MFQQIQTLYLAVLLAIVSTACQPQPAVTTTATRSLQAAPTVAPRTGDRPSVLQEYAVPSGEHPHDVAPVAL